MKQKNNKNGFLLVEVLVSIGIILTTVILYQSALNGVSLVRDAKDQEIALRIAANELETLRANGYSSLPANGSSFSDSNLSSISTGAGSLAISTFNASTKKVDVKVSWIESGSSTQSITLSSLITKTGGLK